MFHNGKLRINHDKPVEFGGVPYFQTNPNSGNIDSQLFEPRRNQAITAISNEHGQTIEFSITFAIINSRCRPPKSHATLWCPAAGKTLHPTKFGIVNKVSWTPPTNIYMSCPYLLTMAQMNDKWSFHHVDGIYNLQICFILATKKNIPVPNVTANGL
jgi:hypothetical protein